MESRGLGDVYKRQSYFVCPMRSMIFADAGVIKPSSLPVSSLGRLNRAMTFASVVIAIVAVTASTFAALGIFVAFARTAIGFFTLAGVQVALRVLILT